MRSEFFSCLDDCGEFARGQAYSFSPVAGQGCDLPEAFRFRFGFRFEKFPSLPESSEIEIIRMRFGMPIFMHLKLWSFHGSQICANGLRMSI
jgi:hypothetical protein